VKPKKKEMKTLNVVLNACTILLLLAALIIRYRAYHILATGEGMPAGFPRTYFEGDGSTILIIIGLLTSIVTLIISISKNKKKAITADFPI
jgi:hypothetical protein